MKITVSQDINDSICTLLFLLFLSRKKGFASVAEAPTERKELVHYVFEESREIPSSRSVNEIGAIPINNDIPWIKVQVAHEERIAIEINGSDRFRRVYIEPSLDVRRLRKLDFFMFGSENTR